MSEAVESSSISWKLKNCVGRVRLLADKLTGREREEANEIASAIGAELERVAGLEHGTTINCGEE
ncbi:hypothetical protein [Desulfovibrio sp. JC010]|uniref:hypothetical protein n=1 Tax=Desulfovibrio sp. JC010 TaxID=2593641 RepID=UPI0013D8B673|nr:hypothetical protein [Desulfovibrio sp. JC010]NDV27743.1 hypothetical protein [Desulfovibrio sp. JC010]